MRCTGVKVVRNGNFVGVVAEQEWQAIQAARRLKIEWQAAQNLPDQTSLYDVARAAATEDKTLLDDGDVEGALVYPLRGALAQLIGRRPETVHVIHVEGSGC